MQNFFWNTDDADFTGGIFTGAHDIFFNILLSFFNDFFNASWVNTTIFHEHFESLTGNFAANWIKATKDNVARSVVNHNVDASSPLQGLDITAFFTDDATFHFFVFQLDAGNGAFSSYFASHTLHGCQ